MPAKTLKQQIEDALSLKQQYTDLVVQLQQKLARTATVIVRCGGGKVRQVKCGDQTKLTDADGNVVFDELSPGMYAPDRVDYPAGWRRAGEVVSVDVQAGRTVTIVIETQEVPKPVPATPLPSPVPPQRRRVTLVKPWDGRVIEEQGLEIDCDGKDLIAQRDAANKIYGGRTITLRDCVVYNFARLYEAATFDTRITLINVVCPDLWDVDGKQVRAVFDDEERVNAKLLQPAGKRYGLYVEAKDVKGKGIQGVASVRINIDGWQCGSLEDEHCLRTSLGVAVTARNFKLWNWANLPKGDKVNGGSALRLHGISADLADGSAGWYAKFGHKDCPMQSLSLVNVRLRGGCNWEGPAIPDRVISKTTLNGQELK